MNSHDLIILAIETSTNLGGISILENDLVLFSKYSREQKLHSELVHQYIEMGLELTKYNLSDFDLFVVSLGPGSFTGIRVSVNTGKAFSYVFKKPLIGISSLDCLAFQNLETILSTNLNIENIFCMINAYKNMVYYAKYTLDIEKLKKLNLINPKLSTKEKLGALTQVSKPQVIPVKDLTSVFCLDSWVIGDGFLTYQNYFPQEVQTVIKRTDLLQDFPTSDSLGQIGLEYYLQQKNTSTFEWNLFSPLYLRASEAEETKKGILYSPL